MEDDIMYQLFHQLVDDPEGTPHNFHIWHAINIKTAAIDEWVTEGHEDRGFVFKPHRVPPCPPDVNWPRGRAHHCTQLTTSSDEDDVLRAHERILQQEWPPCFRCMIDMQTQTQLGAHLQSIATRLRTIQDAYEEAWNEWIRTPQTPDMSDDDDGDDDDDDDDAM